MLILFLTENKRKKLCISVLLKHHCFNCNNYALTHLMFKMFLYRSSWQRNHESKRQSTGIRTFIGQCVAYQVYIIFRCRKL